MFCPFKNMLYLCSQIIVLKDYRRHIIIGTLGLFLFSIAAGGHTSRRPVPNRHLYDNKLDTLSFSERISLRTNMIDWIALTPNIGLELTLGNMNWNRWTLGIGGRWNPSTKTLGTSYNVYDLTDVRLDLRRYQHGRGSRRSFFLGIYGTYGSHNVKLSPTGFKGTHLAAGLSVGTIAPLYSYRNGASLDLEVALSGGVMFAKHDEYRREDDSYVTVTQGEKFKLSFDMLPYIAANDVLRVSLVYHFGPSVANRYKRRIAIDERYRLHLNEMEIRRDSTRQAHAEQKAIRRDSLDKADYEKRFEKQRLELEKKYISDSLMQVKRQAALADTLKQKNKDE
jgi:hypothetical protein